MSAVARRAAATAVAAAALLTAACGGEGEPREGRLRTCEVLAGGSAGEPSGASNGRPWRAGDRYRSDSSCARRGDRHVGP